MKVTLRNYWLIRYFEGDGDGSDDPDPDSNSGDNGGGSLKFTPEQQKHIDGLINKRFAKVKKEKETLIAELNTIKQSANLTKEEREQLASRVDELESSILTEQEKAAKEKGKLEKEYKTKLDMTSSERDTWKRRYEDSTIERALTDAAVKHKAANAAQIRMMFRGVTSLVEEKGEDGKPVGSYTPIMKFQGLGEDGKTITDFEMPVEQALKKIKDDGLNANLFEHSGTPGTGGKPGGGSYSGGKDPGKMPVPSDYANSDDFGAAYQKWRDNYNPDGTKKK